VERIRFYFDPRCPWCYQTSRWASRLEELGEISIDWAFFSLEVINRPEGVDALAIDARSGPALRTASLLRERFGRVAVGNLYHALGMRVWESELPTEVDDLDGIRASLKEMGADPLLLDEALADPGTWEAVVQEHQALVDRTGAFGVPTIVLDGGDGPAIFGPVVYKLPNDEDAVALWRHTTWLVRYGNFAELKRGRGGLPDLPAMEYRARRHAEGKR
jgi:2-hydroxychromene-2-carboxylate isomerase